MADIALPIERKKNIRLNLHNSAAAAAADTIFIAILSRNRNEQTESGDQRH